MSDPACLLPYISNDPKSKGEGNRPYFLQVYSKDVSVKKPVLSAPPPPTGLKADIFQFSAESRNRLLFVCRNSGHLIKSQFCMTYHLQVPVDGLVVKQHLNNFLTQFRKEFPGEHYLWILEFQKRGAPHLHFFSSLSVNDSNHAWLTAAWVKISKGSGQSFRFHSHKTNFFAWEMKSGQYLAKEYLAKSIQKGVPENFLNVGRFWGHSKSMKPKPLLVNFDELTQPVADCVRTAVRLVTKQFEKRRVLHIRKSLQSNGYNSTSNGKQTKISSRNRRKSVRTYSLPLMACLFCDLVMRLIEQLPTNLNFGV